MLGRKGTPNVKREKGRKTARIGCMVTGPAAGRMLPLFFLVPGMRSSPRFSAGTTTSAFIATGDGYGSGEVFLQYMKWLVHKLKEERGLKRALLIMDCASEHLEPRVHAYAKRHNIVMLGLPPQTTGYTQPLDVGFFGAFKKKVWARAAKANIILGEGNIAGIAEAVVTEMDDDARREKTSLLANAFKNTGLVPANPGVFSADAFKPAEARGASASPVPPRKRARLSPETRADVFAPLPSPVRRAIKAASPGIADDEKEDADAEALRPRGGRRPMPAGVLGSVWTSASYMTADAEKKQAKLDKEVAKTQRKVEREVARVARMAAAEEKKLARAAKAEERAAKAAAAAAATEAAAAAAKHAAADAAAAVVAARGKKRRAIAMAPAPVGDGSDEPDERYTSGGTRSRPRKS